MKTKKTSYSIVILLLSIISCEMLAKEKIKFRLPSDEEQRLMREEVYFPQAKADTTLGLIKEVESLLDVKRNGVVANIEAKQRDIIDRFLDNTYAELPASKMKHRVDFDSRREGLKLISEFDVVRSDTNCLYSIAGFIGKGVVLSTAKRIEDLRKIQEVRKHLCFQPEQLDAWESQLERYGCIRGALNVSYFDELIHACQNEYKARDNYNKRIVKFRQDVIALFYDMIKTNGSYPKMDSETVWNEFCQRANVTEEEKMAAEKANLFKEKKNASESDKEAEVSIDL